MQGVQVCQRLLPARKNAPGLWSDAEVAGLGPYIEKRICKHTSYPRGSNSQPRRRVAVNPCTLILMRLRHVRHTRALYSAGSPHRRKHESSTREFTAPTVNTNNLFAISAPRLSIFPFCATVSYVASPISFG